MKVTKRAQKIISLLETRGEISVHELSESLDISPSTLRKQLAEMQADGLVIRTYGGVMPVNRVPDETFENKRHKSVFEKRRIAERARSLIPSGASVALGSGTTVYGLGMLLDDFPRAVIYTNSMQVADYLSQCAGLEVHVSSGIVRGRTGTIIGSEAAEYFRTLKPVDYAFVGCDAINSAGEILSDNPSVAQVEALVLHSARHKYILCDSSKLGKTAVAHIARLDGCDGLITCRSGYNALERYQGRTQVIYA